MSITNEEVTTIAQTILNSENAGNGGRTTYLRALISATQDALDRKKGQEIQTQLKALTAEHKRFYELVLNAIEPFVPRGTKNRAVEIHRRANFARTSFSAIRRWVRAEHDVCGLNVAKTTRNSLTVKAGPPRPASGRRLRARVEAQSKTLVASIIGLADTDKAAAIDEIQLVLGQLTGQLVAMGVVSTRESAQAIAEHRPLKIGKTLFVPTETQVIRHRANPS